MAGRLVRRALLLLITVLAAVLLPAAPASANVSLSTSMTLPSATAVGTEGATGTLAMQNNNSPPQSGESLTVTLIALAPSCGSARSGANVCPTPDPGVFALAPTATGVAGTACAGKTFTVSGPDASGVYTFTPSSPVVLGPPGSGSERCEITFTFSTVKVPTIDADPATLGVQTSTNFRADATSTSGLMVSAGPSTRVTVNRGLPGLSTTAAVVSPGVISDTATVTAAGSGPQPTGTVTFQLFGPNDPTCASPISTTGPVPLAAGTASSGNIAVSQPGTYRFIASYSGDANYIARTGMCNDPGESVVVVSQTTPGDFDADRRADIAVYRPSTGVWFVNRSGGGNTVQTWGLATDIPVPGDYDGDGRADVAVWRPSTGQWFISQSTGGSIVTGWGISGDTPVVGDYDGDGKDDIAVWRPSTGQWFVLRSSGGSTVAVWGVSTDVPVPGDYDGDGKTDVAVYRPSTGQWFIDTSSGGNIVTVWGVSTDVPVPGDYDGDGKTDVAVYRPSTGQWFINKSTGGNIVTVWGVSTDVPVVGDYDGDGKDDIAVYRPSTGEWFISRSSGGSSVILWGVSGDVPVRPAPLRSS